MKKPQWLTVGVAVVLVAIIYFFGETSPNKTLASAEEHHENDGHDHSVVSVMSTDTILSMARRQIKPELLTRVTALESSLSETNNPEQRMKVYHDLAHFWSDTARIFLPYAWYEAEAARLENSEKSLTFAARLFLDNLQQEPNPDLRRWGATQARDLFERSLKLNPGNDSAKVGLGGVYLFGNISDNPMEGIAMIREVVEKDSTNAYAQMMLARGSIVSGQYDKAIERLKNVLKTDPSHLEAILMLADMYERTKDKENAILMYKESLRYIQRIDARMEIEKRISELSKMSF